MHFAYILTINYLVADSNKNTRAYKSIITREIKIIMIYIKKIIALKIAMVL